MKQALVILIIVAAAAAFYVLKKGNASAPAAPVSPENKPGDQTKVSDLTDKLVELESKIINGTPTQADLTEHKALTDQKVSVIDQQTTQLDNALQEVFTAQQAGNVPDLEVIKAQEIVAQQKAELIQDKLDALTTSAQVTGVTPEVAQKIVEVKADLVTEIKNVITASNPPPALKPEIPRQLEAPPPLVTKNNTYTWQNQSVEELVDEGYSASAITSMNRKQNLR